MPRLQPSQLMFIYLVARRRAVKSLSQPDAHYHVCFRCLQVTDHGAPVHATVDTGAHRRIPSHPTLPGDLCLRRGFFIHSLPPPPIFASHHLRPLLRTKSNLAISRQCKPQERCRLKCYMFRDYLIVIKHEIKGVLCTFM